MARTASTVQKRIKLLREARKAVQKVVRASFTKRVQADLKSVDRRMKMIQRQASQGKIKKTAATRSLGKLKKMRRDGQRLLAKASLTKEQALRRIDQTLSDLMEA